MKLVFNFGNTLALLIAIRETNKVVNVMGRQSGKTVTNNAIAYLYTKSIEAKFARKI